MVGNFEGLVSFCTAQGSSYDPGTDSIRLSALESALTETLGTLKAADVSRTAYEHAINVRNEVFKPLSRIARSIVSVLRSNKAPDALIEDCMVIKRRFNGSAKKAVVVSPAPASSPDGSASGEEVKYQRRLSHLDRDSLIANFQALMVRATSESYYQTKEDHLQAPALEAYLGQLRATNKAVIDAFIAKKDVDLEVRRRLFDESGFYGLAKTVKAYIETAFGYRSEKHKQVMKFKFRKG